MVFGCLVAAIGKNPTIEKLARPQRADLIARRIKFEVAIPQSKRIVRHFDKFLIMNLKKV